MILSKSTAALLRAMSYDHDGLVPVFPDFNDDGCVAKPVDGISELRIKPCIVNPTPQGMFRDADEESDIDFLDRFEVKALLGSGAYGRVYMVFDKEDSRNLAMKVIRKRDVLEKNANGHLTEELKISQVVVDCPFVNNAAMIYEGRKHHFLVSQLMSGGDLYGLLKRRGPLNEPETRFYMAEILTALQALHLNNILHRDLNPANIMVDHAGHIAIVDFGLSKSCFKDTDSTRTSCGTAGYVAPEVVVGDPYGLPVDVWAAGCVMFEMLAGRAPFDHPNRKVMNEMVVHDRPDYPEGLSPCVVTLMEGMLRKDQHKRITIAQAMRHPWFTGVDWVKVKRRELTPPIIPEHHCHRFKIVSRTSGNSSSFDTQRDNKSFLMTE